jgi:hypothetical protein
MQNHPHPFLKAPPIKSESRCGGKLSWRSKYPVQMPLMLRPQILKLREQLLRPDRVGSKLMEAGNNPVLRFDVTIAVGNMTPDHVQSGLAVHSPFLRLFVPKSD